MVGRTPMKIDLTDTQVIKPRRIFKCRNEGKFLTRKEVWKDHKQEYHCCSCGSKVEDVTNTETGQSCLMVMAL